jgi:hypothetical protein
MLLYTAIVSPGYFAQKGQWAFLVMFGVILTLAVIAIIFVVRGTERWDQDMRQG